MGDRRLGTISNHYSTASLLSGVSQNQAVCNGGIHSLPPQVNSTTICCFSVGDRNSGQNRIFIFPIFKGHNTAVLIAINDRLRDVIFVTCDQKVASNNDVLSVKVYILNVSTGLNQYCVATKRRINRCLDSLVIFRDILQARMVKVFSNCVIEWVIILHSTSVVSVSSSTINVVKVQNVLVYHVGKFIVLNMQPVLVIKKRIMVCMRVAHLWII